MKRIAAFGFISLFLASINVFGQFVQAQKARDRMDASVRDSEAREKAEKEASEKANRPKPVMNVDVQMVLTRLEYKSFAAAKPFAVSRVVDGDPLWLNIKFNGTLGRYVYTMREADGRERYILFAEIGPQGDVTARAHYLLEFDKEDLKLSELRISLSPGKAGNNASLPLFIKNAAGGKPGLWNNELRLTNIPALPRSPEDHLAKAAIMTDLSGGLTKYRKILSEYDSMVLRNTTDETKLPLVGKFDDATVREEITTRLRIEGISTSGMYFAGDHWAEYSDVPDTTRQARSIWAAFTYNKGKECLYGVANVLQNFDMMNNIYGPSTITFKKGIAIPCGPPK